MPRIGLTFWFVLTTLAGPSLCCCSVPTAAAPKQAPQASHSCCHREPVPVEPAPAAPPSPTPCPCKDNSAQPPAVIAAAIEVGRGDSRTMDSGPLLLPPVVILCSLGQSLHPLDSEQHAGPSRTGRDILCAQHVLRC